MTEYKQCQAKTKSGKTCRRKAQPNAKFCYQHNTPGEQKPPTEKKTNKPLLESPDNKHQHDNGQVPPEFRPFQSPEVIWDLVKAGAIVVATYVSYRIILAIIKR